MRLFLKKGLSCLLIVVIATMLCGVACAQESKQTLKIWLPPFGTGDVLDKEFWASTFVPFEEEHNCDVEVEIIPWSNYEDKYLTAFAGNTGPDVGYMSMEMVSSFITMEAVCKMDDYITDADKQNYLYLENGNIAGGQYMFPFIVGNPRVLLCNMDLLNAAGVTEVPTTWDEFIDVALKVKQGTPEVYPFMQPWGDSGNMVTMFYPFFYQAGGRIMNGTMTQFTIDTAEMTKTVNFLYDLRFTHGIVDEISTSLKAADVKNLFLEGKVAMIIESTNFAPKLDAASINWQHSLLRETRQATFVASDSLVLCTACENKDLAYAAIQFMSSGSVMSAYHNQVSMFSPVGKDEAYADNPVFEYIYNTPEIDLITFPAVADMYKVDDALLRNLQLMELGSLTPEQVISETVAYVQFEMAD